MTGIPITFKVAAGSGTYTVQLRAVGQSGPLSSPNVPEPTQTFANRPVSGNVTVTFNLGVGVYNLANVQFVVFNGPNAQGSCFDLSAPIASLPVNCPAGGCTITSVSIGNVSC